MAVTVRLDNVRLAFANVWEAREQKGSGDMKYDCALLIPKTNKEVLAKLKAAIAEATEEGINKKWGGRKPAKFDDNVGIGDEKVHEETGEVLDGFEGMIYINAKNKNQPQIVGGNRKPITDQSLVYSGCYANVVVNVFPYSSNGNKGVSYGLEAIQKTQDGEPFGGSINVNDVFDDISDGADLGGDTGSAADDGPGW